MDLLESKKEEDVSKENVSQEPNEIQQSENTVLSKSKQKKLKKKEQWLEQKAERRNLQKIKRKQKRQEKIERGEDTGPSRKKLKLNTMSKSSCQIRVAIDCSFDDLMADKDINKLSQQIQYCYSSNRRAKEPLQFYLTSLGMKTKERLDRIGDYQGWDINIESISYLDKFDKSSIVYLTGDSENVLQTLTLDKIYIIGGLVDHNHHKRLCLDLAEKHGIAHAQLPIGDYIQLSSRKVLTVNHVFEILLRYTETLSWKEAFYQVIPRRKQIDGNCDHISKNSIDEKCNLSSDKVNSSDCDDSTGVCQNGKNGDEDNDDDESEKSEHFLENDIHLNEDKSDNCLICQDSKNESDKKF